MSEIRESCKKTVSVNGIWHVSENLSFCLRLSHIKRQPMHKVLRSLQESLVLLDRSLPVMREDNIKSASATMNGAWWFLSYRESEVRREIFWTEYDAALRLTIDRSVPTSRNTTHKSLSSKKDADSQFCSLRN